MTDLERAVAYLNTITHPVERARVGNLLFGKRYGVDVAPLCDPFPED